MSNVRVEGEGVSEIGLGEGGESGESQRHWTWRGMEVQNSCGDWAQKIPQHTPMNLPHILPPSAPCVVGRYQCGVHATWGPLHMWTKALGGQAICFDHNNKEKPANVDRVGS